MDGSIAAQEALRSPVRWQWFLHQDSDDLMAQYLCRAAHCIGIGKPQSASGETAYLSMVEL